MAALRLAGPTTSREDNVSAPRALNPQWIAAVLAGVNPCPYFELQSMRLEDLAWGRAELRIALARKHLQPFGVTHGGVVASIIDAACFWACFSQAPVGKGMTTVDIKLNYLAPAVDGALLASGRCLKLGRGLGLGEASVRDQNGRLLAQGLSTVMLVDNLALPGQDGWPAKFLD